ncbi:type II toxin-antitoxin system RelE/ParE family toxin [Phenylobacterium montanum]|uniref:type II toxin-antitoxin system RelE/ParE family toxin n=1 Tax=Phenylobacterium montanum TaxID=2823693 RepID=UPI002012DF15|nr:type II toxin-antitoxin system RelE/ParE family toxin [Caulobacter sp. S6]
MKGKIDYIAAENPSAARRVAQRIGATAASLGQMSTGRPGRVSRTYEKVIRGLPYIIAYGIILEGEREAITILRVIHAAQDWPDEAWPKPGDVKG